MRNSIDMHIHSINSDGQFQIDELVNKIKENNIKTFSITDHDNIESVNQIIKTNLTNLEFYNGVEISSIYKNIKMHILGYDFIPTIEMENLIKEIQVKRKERCLEIIEMLYRKYGVIIPNDMIKKILDHKVVGKPHIVEALYQLGYGSDNREIFDYYLKDYDSKTRYEVELDSVIKVIKSANGKVILAHPKEIENRYHINIDSILPKLIEEGIDGIEVYNSIHNLEDIERYLSLVKKNDLLISGGSDYHGPFVKPDVMLGKVSREKIVIKELSLVDELRRRNRNDYWNNR